MPVESATALGGGGGGEKGFEWRVQRHGGEGVNGGESLGGEKALGEEA